MDKFTKTTEVDISNMSIVEEETPQKSKVGTVIAIIISIILSISLWLYVVETDETKIEKEYNDVKVNIINATDEYVIKASDVTVVVVGTTSQLVDIDASNIIVEIDASKITKTGRYTVPSSDVRVDEELGINIKDSSQIVQVTVVVEEAK